MDDERPTVGGWIDYLIASDDPNDRALLDEFRNEAWAHGQLMQHITADPANINAESCALLEEGQERQKELQARILARGEALRATGCQPCTEAAFKAWRARWVPLASHLPSDGAGIPRA